jgi:plastocyanin
MRTVALAAVAGLALAVTGASQPASTVTKTVSITATAFSPTSRTIATTDSIKWTNNDTKNHQVVANNGAFVSPTIGPGKSYTHVFNTAGTFRYHDALYPSHTGKIIVNGPPPAITIGAAVPILDYGQSTHISGVVSSHKTGEQVQIFYQPYPAPTPLLRTTVLTTTGGAFSFTVAPGILTTYRRCGTAPTPRRRRSRCSRS